MKQNVIKETVMNTRKVITINELKKSNFLTMFGKNIKISLGFNIGF